MSEHHVTSGEGPQGGRWVAETTQERGTKEAPGGGIEFHSAKHTEYHASSGEGGMKSGAGAGGGPVSGAGPTGIAAPGYQDPDKIPIMPGSETASLEGCQQGPCEKVGGCGGGSGVGGVQPGCGPRGYGFDDES